MPAPAESAPEPTATSPAEPAAGATAPPPAEPAGGATALSPDLPAGLPPAGAVLAPVGRVALGGANSPYEAAPVQSLRYRATPYRPDSIVDGWGAGPFTVRAASVRGDAHRLYGVPRQDDMALAWSEDPRFVVIAVADGVSSAPLSHIGASTACRYAIEYFLREPPTADGPDWREVLEGCAWSVIEAAQRLAAQPTPDPEAAELDFATTLSIVTVRETEAGWTAAAASVGDSGVALLRAGQIVPLLGGKTPSSDGIVHTGVVPLPRVPAEPATGTWDLNPAETLLVGTDGIWDPVGDGLGTVAGFLVGALGENLPERADFLRVVDFCRDTYDDDRTLVAVRFEPPAGDTPAGGSGPAV